ncbi:MAG: hypothetical protein KAQ83_02025 [Nanoarchaeota archaeon]|nr:hypothetical protein [Nanoarchaeota archaeon]
MVTAYCVKCGRQDKEKGKNKPMKNPAIHQTAKGGFMAKGKCPDCDTTMCAMMSKVNAEQAITDGAAKNY